MTGENFLRVYVFVLIAGGVAWAVSVSWLTMRAAARAAWRRMSRMKRARPSLAVRSSEG